MKRWYFIPLMIAVFTSLIHECDLVVDTLFVLGMTGKLARKCRKFGDLACGWRGASGFRSRIEMLEYFMQ
jgi:hypothetical protein